MISKLTHTIWLAFMVMAMSSCELYQEPDGVGNDPTDVIVNADLQLDLALPTRDKTSGTRADGDYLHRFVVEAVDRNNVVHDRCVIFRPATQDTRIMLPVTMRLHAREYNILVWSDYMQNESTDLFYNPESLIPVLPVKSFRANSEYKDAFCGRYALDLSEYADQWQTQVSATIELTRPVGRYELVSVDLGSFRKKLGEGTIRGNNFTARIKYAGYVPTGYNVLEQTPKNLLNFLSYSTSLSRINTADTEITLGFDYVTCAADGFELPVEIEITNELGEVVSNSSVTVPLKAGYNTRVGGRFLTDTSDGGANIDPDYDGTIDVNLGDL